MMAVPIVIFVIAIISLGVNTAHTGLPVTPGIDFSGGTAVTLFTGDSADQIRTYFSGFPLDSIGEGVNNGKYIKFAAMNDAKLQELSALISQRYPDAKVDQIGESFGKTLQEQAIYALIFSFIGMSIVVFIAFRTFVPSVAVVLSAIADMAMTAAAMNVFGLTLNLPTTAALLMLIGYSVDSDILLTMRVLKRQGKFEEKIEGAFRTGIIMTTATLSAIIGMCLVTYLGQVQVIYEISMVLIIGLLFDIMNTWLTNAGILKWYVTRREGREYR